MLHGVERVAVRLVALLFIEHNQYTCSLVQNTYSTDVIITDYLYQCSMKIAATLSMHDYMHKKARLHYL